MTTTTYLNPGDIDLCRDYAEAIQKRHKRTSQAGMVDKDLDRLENDFVSKVCEVAVAHALGLEPNFAINTKSSGGDGGHDLYISKTASTIDVKHSTSYGARLLIWPLTKELSKAADILVFATSHKSGAQAFGVIEIHGWITRFQFMKLADIAGPGEAIREGTRSFPANCLTPIGLLRR